MESPCSDAGLGALLERWQLERDADALAALVEKIRVPLGRVVAHALRRHGIRDPSACDDAVSLVFDRLVRLADDKCGRAPGRFDAHRGLSATDPGWAFVACLARSRARDVARQRRRADRRAAAYAVVAADDPPGGDPPTERADAIARLGKAVAELEERARIVVSLLLEGKSQAVIADVLGVCEGTVSRIRTRAIASLRAALDPRKSGGGAA